MNLNLQRNEFYRTASSRLPGSGVRRQQPSYFSRFMAFGVFAFGIALGLLMTFGLFTLY